ncbi:MAG: Shedu anti-phage system protein SduA domain-containing protein [Bacteroidota bacterium]
MIEEESKWFGKFPDPKYKYHDSDTTYEQFEAFQSIVESNAGEKEIDEFITKNPVILTTALNHFRTGNHKAWVIPKQAISIKSKQTYQKGMIPDFILGGQSSDGQEWWIVELKGANEEIFKILKNDQIKFDDVINKGVCQLLEYVDYASEKQSFLRDSLGLKNFREPNGLLLIGRSSEFSSLNERKKKLKAAWNRLNKGKLEIRTYDWLIRQFENTLARQSSIYSIMPKEEYKASGLEALHKLMAIPTKKYPESED